MADPALTIPASRARRDHVPLGIAFMLAATVSFALSTAISKWQVAHYSFAEVLFLRALGSLPVCALLILPRSGLAVFRTERLRDHVGRSATQAVAQSLIVIALGLMPLAGAVAINFSSPLFATLFAALWLKEKVGLARALALIVGFGGVLLVASPGADSFRSGALFALANAVLFGSVTAAVRGMSATESAETLTMYQMVLLAIFFAIAMPFAGFTAPGGGDLAAMLFNGVLNGVGQYCWTRALTLAPPAAVGPFYYFSIVWLCCSASSCGATCRLWRCSQAPPSWSPRAWSCSGERRPASKRRNEQTGGSRHEHHHPARGHRPRRQRQGQGADRRTRQQRHLDPAGGAFLGDLVERIIAGRQ